MLAVAFVRVVLSWPMKRMINLLASGRVRYRGTCLVVKSNEMDLKSAPP